MFSGYVLKSQIVCRGAKVFFEIVGMSKKAFNKKACFVFVFLCWNNKKRRYDKHRKEVFFFQKEQKIVLGWLGNCFC